MCVRLIVRSRDELPKNIFSLTPSLQHNSFQSSNLEVRTLQGASEQGKRFIYRQVCVPDVRARDVTQHAAMLFQIDKLRNAQTVRNVRAVFEPTRLHDVRRCRANGKWIRYKK